METSKVSNEKAIPLTRSFGTFKSEGRDPGFDLDIPTALVSKFPWENIKSIKSTYSLANDLFQLSAFSSATLKTTSSFGLMLLIILVSIVNVCNTLRAA